jgi:DNA gyrase subunit B
VAQAVKTSTPTRKSYDAKDIEVLEGLEAVRRRPGMYIGSTDLRGLHHLITEVVDNAIDEAIGGYCDTVRITIHPDASVTVSDNGRGIPTGKHPKLNKSALEVVMTILHAGGKFGGDGYKMSSGLHGVGVSVVNGLSEWMVSEVRRDGNLHRQEYRRGIPTGPVKKVGSSEPGEQGTTQTWMPDATIFRHARLQLRHAVAALPRDGLPDEGSADHLQRRAE